VSARDEVLSRIRTAIGNAPGEGGQEGASAPAGAVPRDYRLWRDADPVSYSTCSRPANDYKATVRRTAPSQLAAAIGEALTQRGRGGWWCAGLDLPRCPRGRAVADAQFTQPNWIPSTVLSPRPRWPSRKPDHRPRRLARSGQAAISLVPTTSCASCARARSSPSCRKRSRGCAPIAADLDQRTVRDRRHRVRTRRRRARAPHA